MYYNRPRPADYRIQKMRAAEESAKQMNTYVKVRRVHARIAVSHVGRAASPPSLREFAHHVTKC